MTFFFFFQAEDGIRDLTVTGVQTCALPICLVEPVQVAKYADKHLLHEVFSPLAIADRAIDEVEQPGLIAVHESAERLGVPGQVPEHQPAVLELVQRYALLRTRRDDGWRLPLEGCSHVGGSAVPDGNGPGPRETTLLPQKRHELYRSV